MNLRRRYLCALILATSTPLGAQQAVVPLPVRLDITAESPLREDFQACLRSELEPNTKIVDQGTAVTFAVIASEQRLADGTMLGYLIYAGGYQPAQASGVEGAAAVVIQWQVLRMTPPDLQPACSRLAKEFVENVVVPTRQAQERLQQQLKQAKKKQ